MATGPKARGKRVIKKNARANNSLEKTSLKERSERSGSFHMKARRDDITGEGKPTQAPPDKYMKDGGKIVNFGGKLTIPTKGLGADERREVRHIIENEGDRAAARDKENRILKISSGGGKLTVYTGKNNLAVALGKKLHRARKGGELTVTWSDHDMPVRVTWEPGA